MTGKMEMKEEEKNKGKKGEKKKQYLSQHTCSTCINLKLICAPHILHLYL